MALHVKADRVVLVASACTAAAGAVVANGLVSETEGHWLLGVAAVVTTFIGALHITPGTPDRKGPGNDTAGS